jgi:hypothetical protein
VSLRINQSRVAKVLDCPQDYAYTYEENLAPKHTPPPLITGSALHAGLAVLRQTDKEGNPRTLREAQNAVRAYYREVVQREHELQAFTKEELEAAEIETLWGQMMLARFVRQFPEPEWQILEPEVSGEVQIGNSKHTLVFRVDGLVQWRGQLWLAEYKSKNRITEPYIRSFTLDKQISCYVYGASKQLGRPIAGSLLWIFPKSPTDAPIRFETPLRTPEQLERIEWELIYFCEVIESYRKMGKWPRNERMCYAPGRRPCIFLNLCLWGEHSDYRDQFIERKGDYVDDQRALTAGAPRDDAQGGAPAGDAE